ncbi:unnamed protein product [Dovyalis caffra]|uniref:Protein kinase domain-containing protein n=1 Tax=Dovyalis caffra TaxID=77055 RepID=A0AAV1RWL7_9ROSI|nr:unnamed protein product [Dovyalis caffra]
MNAHALILTLPAQGHVAPTMKLAYRLADLGVKVTFLTAETKFHQLVSDQSRNKDALPKMQGGPHQERVKIVSFPDGLKSLGLEERGDSFEAMEGIVKVMPLHVEEFIKKANQPESQSDEKITSVIADLVVAWALDIANKMGLKGALFLSSAPGIVPMLLQISHLVEAGIVDTEGTPKRKEKVLLSPYLPALSSDDYVWNFSTNKELQKAGFAFVRSGEPYMRTSKWVLCNWFRDLDPSADDLFPNTFSIGPLLANDQPGGNFLSEDFTCLSWLDRQPPGSVVYVSFGSTGKFNTHQFDELALGLRLMGRPFLWVVRPDISDEVKVATDDSFRNRSVDDDNHLGKMVRWAPQEKVLAHPSVACFLTHCGWNSAVEGIGMGVPLLCWPHGGDQFYVRTCVCDGWKVGLEMKADEDGIVTRYEIKRKVDELLNHDGIRANALKLKRLAQNSLSKALVDKFNSCVLKSRIFNKPTSPSSLPMPPPIRYRKGELIGCGAFGHVYMGMNLDSGELLAIKQVSIAANGATRERAQAHVRELEEEVKLLQNLSHPNIVRYLGTVREEETINILLEFVPGGSISSLLGNFGAFPEPVIRAYTKQLLLGLEYLHSNGIMHRDIKVALKFEFPSPDATYFGASKQVVELATVSGAKSMKGTPYWMAPEVILQTGHSLKEAFIDRNTVEFSSADIWSVGCTVIEMATGKPPWSQQYQEVAAIFYIGSTKSHPEIPGHLTPEAKDFLLKCLHKEPNMRPEAYKLLKHPFVTGEIGTSDHVIHSPVMENSGIPLQSYTTNPVTILSCSIDPKQLPESEDAWETQNSDDDMCQIDNDFSINEEKLSPHLTSNDLNKSSDPKCELSGDWRSKYDESPELELAGSKSDTGQPVQGDKNVSFSCGASFSEDDEELTESKIRAFLGEKALELKKLQTPLYEEFYNSLNGACSPSFGGSSRDESLNYLKLPPKSRSPSRIPVGSPSTATDAVSTGSPGSNRRASNVGNASDQASGDNSSPHSNDQKERKWKEELDQELERKREMMRQAAVGSKTLSPKDRALGRQRERTRFASPSK